MSAQHPRIGSRRRLTRTLVIATVVVVALCGAFVWWFFQGDPPGEVDIADAAAQIDGTRMTSWRPHSKLSGNAAKMGLCPAPTC